MGIKGLTTGVPQFPRIGILRKGAPKPENGKRPGRDLEWFRFTSDTNPESVQAFYDAFGKQPNHLTVLMPYSTVDENFEAWQEQWTASRLQHRCDGEHVELYYDEQRGTYIHPQEPKPCPGGCKPVGRLSVIIPALIKAGHVGTVTLKTTSKHDIMNIHGGLTAYYQMRGDLRGIEFVLYRYPEQVTTPDGPRREKWLVGLKAHHEWVTAQLQVMQQRALTTEAPALPSGEVIDGETGEIIEPAEEPQPEPEAPAQNGDGDGDDPEPENIAVAREQGVKLARAKSGGVIVGVLKATMRYQHENAAKNAVAKVGKALGFDGIPGGIEDGDADDRELLYTATVSYADLRDADMSDDEALKMVVDKYGEKVALTA